MSTLFTISTSHRSTYLPHSRGLFRRHNVCRRANIKMKRSLPLYRRIPFCRLLGSREKIPIYYFVFEFFKPNWKTKGKERLKEKFALTDNLSEIYSSLTCISFDLIVANLFPFFSQMVRFKSRDKNWGLRNWSAKQIHRKLRKHDKNYNKKK